MHNEITIEFLEEIGFAKVSRTDYFSLRISDDLVFYYESIYGFMEMRRHVDGRKRHAELMMCLPKPYRTEKDFMDLIKAIVP